MMSDELAILFAPGLSGRVSLDVRSQNTESNYARFV